MPILYLSSTFSRLKRHEVPSYSRQPTHAIISTHVHTSGCDDPCSVNINKSTRKALTLPEIYYVKYYVCCSECVRVLKNATLRSLITGSAASVTTYHLTFYWYVQQLQFQCGSAVLVLEILQTNKTHSVNLSSQGKCDATHRRTTPVVSFS